MLVNSNWGKKFWLLRKGNNQSSYLSFNIQRVGIIFTSSNIWILVANILEKVKLYFGFQLWRLLSPGSTRPISYPGPFRIILSFLGSPRESSCCYRHPTGTFHHFLSSDPVDSPCSKSPGAVCEVPSWSWGSTLFLDPARRIVLTPGPGQSFFLLQWYKWSF